MENKKIRLDSLTLVYNESENEFAGIIRDALAAKYSITLPESGKEDYVGSASIVAEIDPSYPLRRYSIDIKADGGIRVAGDHHETVYFAVQRLVNSLFGAEPEVEETHIYSYMLLVSDPSILAYDGKYYQVGFVCNGRGNVELGYEIYTSDNLYDWSLPVRAFNASDCKDPAFDGFCNFWAPEIWEYRGKFYIFATYRSKATNHRGCAVFRSDKPDGKYEMITDGHMTPKDWDCIDNSLYIDENGDPWMTFVHEWTSMPDHIGTMCVCRLSDDLSRLEGEITTIFKANEAPFNPKNGVTDGPFIYRFKSGKLAMIWSYYYPGKGYCIGTVHSEGDVRGPWVQDQEILYERNDADYRARREGGHGFIFRDLEGNLKISFHCNNNYKWLCIRDLSDEGDVLRII